MLIYIFSLLLLTAVWIAYKYYFKPKAQMRRCKETFEKLGYSVCMRPFTFFGIGVVTQLVEAGVKHKDSLYYDKTVYVPYDITLSNALDKVWIMLTNPELIKEFLSAQTNPKFPKHQIGIRGVKAVLGNGLAFTEGKIWKNKRKIISKAFNFELLQENIPKIVEIYDDCLELFDRKWNIDQTKVKYDVCNLSTIMMNRIMLLCFFGTGKVDTKIHGQNFDEFIMELMEDATIITFSPLILIFGMLPYNIGVTKKIREVKESIAILRQIAREIIQKRKKQIQESERPKNSSDIIQSLVYQTMDEAKKNEKIEYSDEDLIDEFLTFIVAGTDTTTRFIAVMIYYVCINPEVQKKLRETVNSIIKSNQDITHQNLKKLVYIDWIQNETLRMYGPGNGLFPRVASEDCLIKDLPISKGSVLNYQPISNHYNPKYFKDPHVFHPERWESECEGNHPYAFAGFSGGPRSCIGKSLALLQSKMLLVKLVMRYKGMTIPNPNISFTSKFMYEPSPFDTVFERQP